MQNILVFRFANGIFEPIWNRRYIDHVQLTVAETVGVEERGPYYDETGALRGYGAESHLPVDHADGNGATHFLRSRCGPRRADEDPTSHAAADAGGGPIAHGARQYSEGVIDGEHVPGYRSEPRVPRIPGPRPSLPSSS